MKILSLKKLVLSVGADSRGFCALLCAWGYPHHVLSVSWCGAGVSFIFWASVEIFMFWDTHIGDWRRDVIGKINIRV